MSNIKRNEKVENINVKESDKNKNGNFVKNRSEICFCMT